MKLSNIFKKKKSAVTKANIKNMDKKQLEKVVGGTSGGGAASASYAATGYVVEESFDSKLDNINNLIR